MFSQCGEQTCPAAQFGSLPIRWFLSIFFCPSPPPPFSSESPPPWPLALFVPWFRAGSCLPLVRAQESAIRAGAGGRWEAPWGGTWPVWVRKWLRESHRLAMWCWSRLQFFCSACRRLSISSTSREARKANLAEAQSPYRIYPISLFQPYHKSTPPIKCIIHYNWHPLELYIFKLSFYLLVTKFVL